MGQQRYLVVNELPVPLFLGLALFWLRLIVCDREHRGARGDKW